MGTTLHNKIHLGRSSILSSRKAQAALVIGALVGLTLVCMALGLRVA